MRKPLVITGTVGKDVHVIGTKILSRALREAGFEVLELGCLVPPEEFIKEAKERKADAILMSSLYGMAELDLRDFKEKCQKEGLEDVILYIGGLLCVGKEDFSKTEARFKRLGFHRVYPPDVDLKDAINDLIADLKERGKWEE